MGKWLSVLAASVLWLAASMASAHEPHFREAAPIALPDGRAAELRLLVGDGIIGPDPARPVVLSPQGEVLALGRRNQGLAGWTLVCTGPDGCAAVEVWSGTAFVPAPSSLRPWAGPREGGIRELEAAEAAWGFRERPATRAEWLAAEAALVGRDFRTGLLVVALGSGASAAVLRSRARRHRRLRPVLLAGAAASGIVAVAAFLPLALMLPVTGPPTPLWGLGFAALVLALAGWAVVRLARWGRRRISPAGPR
ncbi:MAG TPA: hypothetical protein VEB20_03355 [Azospirillaceae bacterium]|nr:hypothetical protein [Azospirillaceae bacterium]